VERIIEYVLVVDVVVGHVLNGISKILYFNYKETVIFQQLFYIVDELMYPVEARKDGGGGCNIKQQ